MLLLLLFVISVLVVLDDDDVLFITKCFAFFKTLNCLSLLSFQVSPIVAGRHVKMAGNSSPMSACVTVEIPDMRETSAK